MTIIIDDHYETIKLSEIKSCQFLDCTLPAVVIAYDRARQVIEAYCDAHASQIVGKECPEYTEWCPNCGCVMGIN